MSNDLFCKKGNSSTNQKIYSKQKRTAFMLFMISFLFIVCVTGQHAQMYYPASFYDSISWTWSYAGPYSSTYNCLSYAIGVTNTWTWPWSGNATSSQVSSYLHSKGYHVNGGGDAEIISYGPSSNSIAHFSKVTGGSTCRAKWGALELIDHGSWNPYYAASSYGSQRSVYREVFSLWVVIDGPDYVDEDAEWTWELTIHGGNPPFSYEWYFDGDDYNYQLMSTNSYVDLSGRFDNDVTIEVKVTDATGRVDWDSLYVTAGQGQYRSNNMTSVSSDLIKTNVNYLLQEAVAKNIISSNPYDYINSPYFREIVQMGPAALMPIRTMILRSKENGLKQYILAIASEKIAKLDLKKDTFAWTNAKEYRRAWDKHMRGLATNFKTIMLSRQSEEDKNTALVKLGTPVIPYIVDEIAKGKTELNHALRTLLTRTATPAPQELSKDMQNSINTRIEENSHTIDILRKINNFYKK